MVRKCPENTIRPQIAALLWGGGTQTVSDLGPHGELQEEKRFGGVLGTVRATAPLTFQRAWGYGGTPWSKSAPKIPLDLRIHVVFGPDGGGSWAPRGVVGGKKVWWCPKQSTCSRSPCFPVGMGIGWYPMVKKCPEKRHALSRGWLHLD
jgi:hypothetical protein